MTTINVNGNITVGKNVVINNGKVIIDGKEMNGDDSKNISITITGDVSSLSVDYCNTLQINGQAGSVNTVSADVSCHNVGGNINTVSGDVVCKEVSGNVSSVSGDISC